MAGKILQIQADHGDLFALKENGKVYRYFRKEKQICDKDRYKEATTWSTVAGWEELPEGILDTYTKPQELPF